VDCINMLAGPMWPVCGELDIPDIDVQIIIIIINYLDVVLAHK
jgi:hypothetical protein